VVGSYDLVRHAATSLGATRLVRQWLADEGKSGPLGPGFLDGPVSQRQPLPWPGIGWGLGRYVSFEAHPGSGDFVARPTVHVIQNIRLIKMGVILVACGQWFLMPGSPGSPGWPTAV
jgi:hypothetical protein